MTVKRLHPDKHLVAGYDNRPGGAFHAFYVDSEHEAAKKREYISSYIPHISNALRNILGLNDRAERRITSVLTDVLERSRKP